MANTVNVAEVVLSSDRFRSDDKGVSSTRHFVVRIDTLSDQSTLIDDVLAALPQRGSVHPRCSQTWANDIDVTMRGEDNRTYDAVVQYTKNAYSLTAGGATNSIAKTPPWEDGVTLRIETSDGEPIVIRHAYGYFGYGKNDAFYDATTGQWKKALTVTGGPIPLVNSAGDAFKDPPTDCRNVAAVQIGMNLQETDVDIAQLLSLDKTINAVDLNLSTYLLLPKYCGKITGISCELKTFVEDDETTPASEWAEEKYWSIQVSIGIQMRSWNAVIADRGFRNRGNDGVMRDIYRDVKKLNKISEPASLRGIGYSTPTTDTYPNPLDEVYVGYMIYPAVSWTYINNLTLMQTRKVYASSRSNASQFVSRN